MSLYTSMNSQRDNSGKSAAAGVAIGLGATAIGAFMATKLSAMENPSEVEPKNSQYEEQKGNISEWNSESESWSHDISWLTEQNYFINNEEQFVQFLETAETNGIPLEEINKISAIIKHNLENGVDVLFSSEYNSGYLGTYDPTQNLITIMPETVDMGYEDVLKVMTHETVHAEQDIADGLDNDTYQLIGSEINAYGAYNVENYYSEQSQEVQQLELEANSSEVAIDETLDHMGVEC